MSEGGALMVWTVKRRRDGRFRTKMSGFRNLNLNVGSKVIYFLRTILLDLVANQDLLL